jgi:putative endonuclease
MFFAYIVQSLASGRFYIGHSDDVDQRVEDHNTGRSHYTKGRGPWELVYAEAFRTRAEAMSREREIKKRKSKRYIEKLIKKSGRAGKELLKYRGTVG